MEAGFMNPFTYLRQKREARRRKRTALHMLMQSGVVRPVSVTVRYEMTPKEFKKMMEAI